MCVVSGDLDAMYNLAKLYMYHLSDPMTEAAREEATRFKLDKATEASRFAGADPDGEVVQGCKLPKGAKRRKVGGSYVRQGPSKQLTDRWMRMWRKGIEWCRRSAKAGHPWASFMLGVWYLEGRIQVRSTSAQSFRVLVICPLFRV